MLLLSSTLALLVVATPGALAQIVPGGSGSSLGSAGVFKGPEVPPVNQPPGGSSGPPGDAGVPGGNDDDGNQGGFSGGIAGGAGTPGGVATAGRRPTTAGSGKSRSPGVSGGGAPRARGTTGDESFLGRDRWDAWWETNKFDFISLRRVSDARLDQQGGTTETPAELATRLAAVREEIRARVIPVLRTLTQANDPAVRAAAAVSIGKIRDREAVDAVQDLLDDGNFLVRRSAMLGLGVLDSGRASYALMNIAGDTRNGRELLTTPKIPADDRGTALIALTLRGPATAAQQLHGMLAAPRDVDLQLLAMAAEAAGLSGSAEFLRPLTALAVDDGLPEFVRSSAITALGRIGDPSTTATLLELLDDGIQPRRAAAVALGGVAHPGSRSVIEHLAATLENESDAPTRHFAAISLGRIGGDLSREVLWAAFRDAAGDMRPWLALGLGMCEDADPRGDVAPELVRRLQTEPSRETQGAYVIALGLCRTDVGLDAIADLVSASNQELAGHAALALGLSGQPDAATILRQTIRATDSPILLRQAALGLGVLGDPASIPELLSLIERTPNPWVASFAAIGIALMGDEDAVGPLLHIIERKGPQGVTTTWATAAVGQLFDSDRRPALSRLAARDNFHARATAVDNLLDLGF